MSGAVTVQSSIGRFAMVPEWLLRSASDEAVKLFAFVWAVYANQHHRAFPTLTTIAEDMKCKPAKVKRVMRELIDLGAVEIKHRRRADGTQRSSLYLLRPERPASLLEQEIKNDPLQESDNLNRDNHLADDLQEIKKQPLSGDQKTDSADFSQNTNNSNVFNDIRQVSGDQKRSTRNQKEPYVLSTSLTPESLMGIWNAHCRTLPACALLSSRRRTEARKRIKEQPDVAVWETVAKAIGSDPGCNGGNKTGWRASFDYFLKPDTWLMVVEGRLTRRPSNGNSNGRSAEPIAKDANQSRRQVRNANLTQVAAGEICLVGDLPSEVVGSPEVP